MDFVILLSPLSVMLAFLIGGVFWWSVQNGQFDDLDGPAYRILADDDSGQCSASPRVPLTSINPEHAERP